jgi:hypothetical protein
VGKGAGDVAKLHEGARETGPSPHIRACFGVCRPLLGLSRPRDVSLTRPRASLQEDNGLVDNDEIRCRVRIAAEDLPPAVTPDAFTDQEILVG